MPGSASGSPKDVFARERQDHIARLVEEHGRARVADLAARFAVSTVTIRKDLVILDAARRLVRAHGGAIAAHRSRAELSFDIRERLQADEKVRIGAAAAELVHDGESIVMDASTTALSVARHLKTKSGWRQLTIITNGDSPLVHALQLSAEHTNGKAPPWCVCLAATYACLAFFAGRLSMKWRKVLKQVQAADEATLTHAW